MDMLDRNLVARRNFLVRLGGTVLAYSFGSLASLPWVGPAAAERVTTVSGSVTWPKGKTIPAGHRLRFDPNASTTVTVSGGNLIVEGVLEMRPAVPGVVHMLRFTNIAEATFVGGGDAVVASDRGLWVIGSGKLDVSGEPKLAWGRATAGLPAGATSITLDADPMGWRVGDEILISPTEPPTVTDHWKHHEIRTITGISGRAISFSPALTWPHPSVTIEGRLYAAEVANLTRNVRIEGTPGGRSHISIHNHAPVAPHISYLAMRHMGPQENGKTVLGRWPLHIHRNDDNSRGGVVEGVVVRDAGSHAFVSHRSHGVTFRDCIAHNVQTAPFWWDQNFAELPEWQRGDFTSHDITYKRCIASAVTPTPAGEGAHRLGGFSLQTGERNTVRGCVAWGVAGLSGPARHVDDRAQPAGYVWPAQDIGTWFFDDNLAHNCSAGILSWQNDTKVRPPIRRFTAYHCGSGIVWGAYFNRQDFDDCILYGMLHNGVVQFAMPAQSDKTGEIKGNPIVFDRVIIDQAGFGRDAVIFPGVRSWPDTPIIFRDCVFKGYVGKAIVLRHMDDTTRPLPVDFVNPSWSGPAGSEFFLHPNCSVNAYVRVQVPASPNSNFGEGTIALKRHDQAGGTPVRAWGARRHDIRPFA
jgi:hypothetical protein